jgi:hypothetical protein
VIGNARLLVDLADKHNSAAAFFAAWPSEDYVGLLRFVEKQGARMGGLIGQRAFREMGRDGYLLSEDVIRRLYASFSFRSREATEENHLSRPSLVAKTPDQSDGFATDFCTVAELNFATTFPASRFPSDVGPRRASPALRCSRSASPSC